VKEDLPRIRFANPDLSIEVRKFCKVKDEQWSPTIEVVGTSSVFLQGYLSREINLFPIHIENENTTTVDLHQKHSSTILKELMSVAGGDPWKAHVEHSEKNGLPIVPGEGEYEHILSVSASSSSGSGKAKAGKGQPTGLTKTSKFAFKKEGDKSGLPSLDEWRKKNEKRVEKRDEEIRVRKENKEKRKKEGKGKVGEKKEGTEKVEEPVKATS